MYAEVIIHLCAVSVIKVLDLYKVAHSQVRPNSLHEERKSYPLFIFHFQVGVTKKYYFSKTLEISEKYGLMMFI